VGYSSGKPLTVRLAKNDIHKLEISKLFYTGTPKAITQGRRKRGNVFPFFSKVIVVNCLPIQKLKKNW